MTDVYFLVAFSIGRIFGVIEVPVGSFLTMTAVIRGHICLENWISEV